MSGLSPVVVAAGGLRVFQRGAPRSPGEAGLHVGPVSPVDPPDTPALEARVDDGRVWRRLWQTANRLVVHFVDQAVVAVSDEGLVTFDRLLPAEMEQHLLMDHILPLVLATSGAVVVHGGVISLDGRGAVLVGSSGAGKSTLTAFAWKQGWVVGGDDGAVVAPGPPPTAEPTYPTIRLTLDSLPMLDIDPAPSAPIAGKIRITSHGTDGFRPEPVELRVIALLVPAPAGADATFEAIDGVDAHAELFGSTFHVDLTMPNVAKTVDDLGSIVDTTTVGRLTVPRGLPGLSAAERLLASAVVVAHAGGVAAAGAMRGLRIGRVPQTEDVGRFLHQLTTPSRMSAIRATVDGLIVARTLRRSGVRPLFPRLREGGKVDVERATEVAAAVDAGLGLLPMAPTCLRRSMTLLRELARLDLAAALHVGVRHQEARIEAHAWVQVNAFVVNDDPTVILDFVELPVGDFERLAPHLR